MREFGLCLYFSRQLQEVQHERTKPLLPVRASPSNDRYHAPDCQLQRQAARVGVLGRPAMLRDDAPDRGGEMIYHKSVKTHHELARLMPISFAARIEADDRHKQIECKRATEIRARNKAYWQSFKNREGEGNGINSIQRGLHDRDGAVS